MQVIKELGKVVGDYTYAKIIHSSDHANLRSYAVSEGYVVYFFKADGTPINKGTKTGLEYKDALEYAKQNVNN